MSPYLMPMELFGNLETIKGKSVGLSYLLYNQLSVKKIYYYLKSSAEIERKILKLENQ